MTEPTAADLLDEALRAERLGRFDDAREQLRLALASRDEKLALDVRLRMGRLCLLGGEHLFDEAQAVLSEARRMAESGGSRRQAAAAIHLLALLERRRGRLDEARRLLDESPVLRETAAPGPETAQLYHYRGLMAADRGQLAQAERLYFRAHALYEEARHTPGLAEVCDSLAGVLLKRGKTKSALRFCEKSLELKRSLGDRYGEAITLGTMGRIYVRQARYREARRAFDDDLALARELGDPRGVGIMLNSLGEVAWLRDRAAEAERHYRSSLAEVDAPTNQAHSWLGLARVFLTAGRLDDAEDAIRRMEGRLAELPPNPLLTGARQGLRGSLAWRRGQFDVGEALLNEAIQSVCGLNQPLDSIAFLYELRDLYQEQREMPKAVAVMQRALDLLSECGAERGVGDVEQWLRTVDEPMLTRLALERQLPEILVDGILKGKLSVPPPKKQPVAILFSDVRGFTSLTESLPPEEVVELLNEWFSEATRAVRRYGGIIDKFIGDAVMALFGVPDPREDAAADAVRTALELRDALSALNLRQQALGGKTLQVGIGIDVGEAIVGSIGSHLRQSYTAIGDPVNTAARLEAATKDHPGSDILISESVEDVQSRQRVAETTFLCHADLRGKSRKVAIYTVRGPHGGSAED